MNTLINKDTYPDAWAELNELLDLNGTTEINLVDACPSPPKETCAWVLYCLKTQKAKKLFLLPEVAPHITNSIASTVMFLNDLSPWTPDDHVKWLVNITRKLNELLDLPVEELERVISVRGINNTIRV